MVAFGWFRRRRRTRGAEEPYVFISYKHAGADTTYATGVADALARAGVAAWLDHDPEVGLGSGDRWDRVLRERVDGCAAMLVVMSPGSLASPWVRLETGRARYQRRPLHPVLLSGSTFAHLEALSLQHEEATVPPSSRLLDRLRSAVTAGGAPVAARAGIFVGPVPAPNPHFTGRVGALLNRFRRGHHPLPRTDCHRPGRPPARLR